MHTLRRPRIFLHSLGDPFIKSFQLCQLLPQRTYRLQYREYIFPCVAFITSSKSPLIPITTRSSRPSHKIRTTSPSNNFCPRNRDTSIIEMFLRDTDDGERHIFASEELQVVSWDCNVR